MILLLPPLLVDIFQIHQKIVLPKNPGWSEMDGVLLIYKYVCANAEIFFVNVIRSTQRFNENGDGIISNQ